MKILKSKWMYKTILRRINSKDLKSKENFKEWNYFLNKYFTIEKEILEIEFQKDRLIFIVKDFWWFVKRFPINYNTIIMILMKEFNLSILEKHDTFELILPKEINGDRRKFVIYKSNNYKIELFLQFLDYINFFKELSSSNK